VSTVLLTLLTLALAAGVAWTGARRRPAGTRVWWLGGVVALSGALALSGAGGVAWGWLATAWGAVVACAALAVRAQDRAGSRGA
jgi:hypothetical protein